MEIPFTVSQFFELFRAYNQTIWPVPIGAYALGITAVALAFTRHPDADRVILGILAGFWAWMGAIYHIGFFSGINPAAYVFGALFIVEAGLLAGAMARIGFRPIQFQYRSGPEGWIGGALILYAMVVYPILGGLHGHGYPYAPLFGVAPCPTTIFTFGMFLWTRRVPLGFVVIPFLWSIVGTTAAIYLGVPEDWGLGVAGLVGGVLLVYREVYGSPATTAAH